jgi:hypothetical protein
MSGIFVKKNSRRNFPFNTDVNLYSLLAKNGASGPGATSSISECSPAGFGSVGE